jgi:predicted kinase
MAVLLLLNGPPAVGKSTLAQRFLEDHPLALLVEVDALRMSLGQWRELDDSKLAARTLALALVDAHLEQGLDVVVPQYLGRPELIEALAAVAASHHARFVEVFLMDDKPEVVRRFLARRDELARSGEMHPEGDVPLGDVEADADDWLARLDQIRSMRPDTRLIAAGEGLDAAYAALLAQLADHDSD